MSDLSQYSDDQLLQMLQQQGNAAPAPSAPTAQPHSWWEKFSHGLGDAARGTAQTLANTLALSGGATEAYPQPLPPLSAQALTQGAEALNQQIKERESQWQAARAAGGDTGVEWTRGLGNAAATLPALALVPEMGPGVLPGMAAGGFQGLVSALAQPVTSGDYSAGKTKQIGLTTGISSLFGGLLNKAFNSGEGAPAAYQPPTRAQVKGAGAASFKAMRDAGVNLRPDVVTNFAEELPSQIEGYSRNSMPTPIYGLIKDIKDTASEGPVPLDELAKIRSTASQLSTSPDNYQRFLAGQIKDHIDNFVENIKPDYLDTGSRIKPEGMDWYTWRANETQRLADASKAMQDGTDLWRTQSKMKNITDILETANNLENPGYIKGAFTRLAKSNKYAQYTPEEQSIITSIAKGNLLDNAAIFKLTGALGMAHGDLGGLAEFGAAHGAKMLANSRRVGAASNLVDLIGQSSGVLGSPIPMEQQMLASMKQQLLSHSGKAAGLSIPFWMTLGSQGANQ